MTNRRRKSKVRWSALGGLLATVGGVVATIVTSPAVIASAAGKFGVSTVLAGAIVNAVAEPLLRKDHER